MKKLFKVRMEVFVFVLLGFIIVLTGCGKADRNGSKKSDDGRSYGGQIDLEQEDIAHTAFFDVKIEDAKKYTTYQFSDGLYQADEGMLYVMVTVTIKNTYAENLDMSITDFTLDYDGNDKKNVIYGYGKEEVSQDSFMENVFSLKKGESITKSILYIVPEMEHFYLNYSEYYTDEFEGDSYTIKFSPQKSMPITTESVEGDRPTTGDE